MMSAGGRVCSFLPGPASFDFDDEGPTEKGADEDEQAENQDVVEGGFEGDGANDVGGDEDFETEQERAAEPNFEGVINIAGLAEDKRFDDVLKQAVEDRDEDDDDRQRFDGERCEFDIRAERESEIHGA